MLCKSNGGERGWSPIALEKEGGCQYQRKKILINKDNGNVIRKMKEGNNIQKKKRG
jgi:hypothetical protein